MSILTLVLLVLLLGLPTGLNGQLFGFVVSTIKTFQNPPWDMVGLPDGSMIVSNSAEHTLVRIYDSTLTTSYDWAGLSGVSGFADGPLSSTLFNYPGALALDSKSEFLYVGDTNNYVRKINIGAENCSTFKHIPEGIYALAASDKELWIVDGMRSLQKIKLENSQLTRFYNTYDSELDSITVDQNRMVIFSYWDSTYSGVVVLDPDNGYSVEHYGGLRGFVDGEASEARFEYVGGVLAIENEIYAADVANHRIRRIVRNTPSASGEVTTFSGTGASTMIDGPIGTAAFSIPWVITSGNAAITKCRNFYVLDSTSVRAIRWMGLLCQPHATEIAITVGVSSILICCCCCFIALIVCVFCGVCSIGTLIRRVIGSRQNQAKEQPSQIRFQPQPQFQSQGLQQQPSQPQWQPSQPQWQPSPPIQQWQPIEMQNMGSFGSTSHSQTFIQSTASTTTPINTSQSGSVVRFGSISENQSQSTSSVSTSRSKAAEIRIDTSCYEINPEEVVIQRKLGTGAYGIVYLGLWNSQEVAIKKLKDLDTLDDDEESRAVLKEFEKEVSLLAQLRHPNVLTFFGAMLHFPQLAIVTEFCCNGSLHDQLYRKKVAMTWKLKLSLAFDVSKAMAYLHKHNLIHRDLKPHNVLIDDRWAAKVCDFGLSRVKESQDRHSMTQVVGSVLWMAPEVTLGNHGYGSPCDVFSYGVILSELLTRKSPYSDREKDFQQQIHIKVALDPTLRPKIPENFPIDIAEEEAGMSELISEQQLRFVQLMTLCWAADPQERPTFEESIMVKLGELHKEATSASTAKK